MAKERVVYKMRVAEIIDHTPTVRELDLRVLEPASFKFAAGQFVMLHVPQQPKAALRAYSIASDERDESGFRLLFKFVEGGLASKFVWNFKGDEVLHFTGPFGRVFFKEPPSPLIIMLNTGTGVSQHFSYLVSKAEKYPQVQFRMFFGVRNEPEIYYQKQLAELTQKFPNFKFEYVLSRPSEQWPGKKGYVQNFIGEFDYLHTDTTFYLCGNGNMIKDVKKKLLEEQGFDKTKIFAEAFD